VNLNSLKKIIMRRKTKKFTEEQAYQNATIANQIAAIIRKGVIKHKLNNTAILELISDLAADAMATIDRQRKYDPSFFTRYNYAFHVFYKKINELKYLMLAMSLIRLGGSDNDDDIIHGVMELMRCQKIISSKDNNQLTDEETEVMIGHADEVRMEVVDFIEKRADGPLSIENHIMVWTSLAFFIVKSIEMFGPGKFDAKTAFLTMFKNDYDQFMSMPD